VNAPVAGSLFSGVGGLDLGLHRAGFQHAFFCESDPWRRTVLAAHWPGVPIHDNVASLRFVQPDGTGDIAAATEGRRDLGEPGQPPVDLLCGGFPCQDLSVAGQRKGLAGARSGLFHEFARIIDTLRPGWVLLENVPGLLSSNSGRDFGIVLGTLADIGYGVAWRVVDSRFFGVPQRRRRVFILGTLAQSDPRAAAERAGQILAVGTRCDRHPPTGTEAREDVAVASLSGLGTGGPDDNDGQAGRVIAHTLRSEGADASEDGTGRGTPLVAAPLTKGSASGEGVNAPGRRQEHDVNLVTAFYPTGGAKDGFWQEDISPPMKVGTGVGAPSGIGVAQATGVRRLTPVECERLQAWPDGWTNPSGKAPDSRRYAACGDGVTSTVSEWIGRRLIGAMA
jgi:DNA (cytosine-5)-methyltransferase 1